MYRIDPGLVPFQQIKSSLMVLIKYFKLCIKYFIVYAYAYINDTYDRVDNIYYIHNMYNKILFFHV